MRNKAMNLTIIKPEVRRLNIGKKTLNLKYNLRAFAHIEEKFGSVTQAIETFNKKDETAILQIFAIGLLYTEQEFDISKMKEEITLEIMAQAASAAMSDALCTDYGFDKEFDWPLLYFIARPALNFSEYEFWEATPKKILGLLKILEKVRGQEKQDAIADPQDAVKAFASW